MAHPGRSSHDDPDGSPGDGPYARGSYPRDQYPDGRNRQGAQGPAWPGPSEQGPWPGYPGPPPGDPMDGGPMPGNPVNGYQPTGSRQAYEAAGPRPSEMARPEWADPAGGRRWTGPWGANATAGQPWLPQERPDPRAAPVRAAATNPMLAPVRTTGALSRATGAMRTTGAQTAADANSGPGAIRTTGALTATGALRTSGAMRTAKPITPGTGKARVILPGVVLGVIAAGFLAVMYLWWRDTLFQHGHGALLIDIGEVLGLIGGYGVVILVALMSRLPPLEKAIGTDRLGRWHATGGRWVITAITGHVVFIVWGMADAARASVTGETVTLEREFPDILMATVAWLLLLMVAAFSMRAARRRIAYETWYYAHLYTYLAIALAFSHQFADGGAFALSLQARVAWSALYAAVGGLLLWYRIITPLRNAVRHQFTVQAVRPEAPGIVSILISGREFDHLRAEPGQFFRFRFLTRELWWQSHPYSLSAMPQPDLMRITVKALGDHSGSVASLRPGTRIIAEGPYGAFTPSLTGRRVLFIAGGVGITPIRAMFAALPKRMHGNITLLYRASHPRDVVFSRELNAIAKLGFDPIDDEHLVQTVPGLHRCEAYVCGPSGMTMAAVNALVEAGLPRRRIHHESFDF
jgi:predicted ferric reductase